MKAYSRNPIFVAVLLMLFMAAIFFLIPINIFDGEVTYDNGKMVFTRKQPLSLSYFIGIVSEGDSLASVKEMHLIGKGYFMAVLLIVGFPSLIGYRVWLGNQNRKNTSKEQQ